MKKIIKLFLTIFTFTLLLNVSASASELKTFNDLWTSLGGKDSFSLEDDYGAIKDDVDLRFENTKYTLDLNGHGIDANGNKGSVIKVGANSELIIKSTASKGTFANSGDEGCYGIYVENGGKVYIENVNFDCEYFGVYVEEGGIAFLENCTFGTTDKEVAIPVFNIGTVYLNNTSIKNLMCECALGCNGSSKTYLGGTTNITGNKFDDGDDDILNKNVFLCADSILYIGEGSIEINSNTYSISPVDTSSFKIGVDRDYNSTAVVEANDTDYTSYITCDDADDEFVFYNEANKRIELADRKIINLEIDPTPISEADVNAIKTKRAFTFSGGLSYEVETSKLEDNIYFEKAVITFVSNAHLTSRKGIYFEGQDVSSNTYSSEWSDEDTLINNAKSSDKKIHWSIDDGKLIIGKIIEFPTEVITINLNNTYYDEEIKNVTSEWKHNGLNVTPNEFTWYKGYILEMKFDVNLTAYPNTKFDNTYKYYYACSSYHFDNKCNAVIIVNGDKIKVSEVEKDTVSGNLSHNTNTYSYWDGTDLKFIYRFMPDVKRTSSGSSKKYKVTDDNGNTKTVKKGSKVKVNTIEGKKVENVKAYDKNGNEIEVILNEDGTYSYTQPSSDVTVEVTYHNREITLKLGSTEAEVDGEKSKLDVAPIIRNDRTMLPIRFIAENLGAKVLWNELEPNKVVITRGDINIEITIGSDIAKVNGKEYNLDSVAFTEKDRTYMPVRFISEALRATVLWNEEDNTVKIIEE